MPTAHANLSPSAAHRWIQCPASVRASAGVPTTSSPYAEEGTRAHTLAEIEAGYAFGLISRGPYLQRHKKAIREAKAAGDDTDEMERHVEAYADLLGSLIQPGTSLLLEQRMDTGVPECWGTADAVLISGSVLQVVDFKYGRGVPVDAEGNEQLRLYGVAALDTFDLIGDIEEVRMTVFQPRLEHTSTEVLTAYELLQWRADVAETAARKALGDDAEFHPSESACRFCPIAGDCRARLEYVTRQDFGSPDLLEPAELAEALEKAPDIRKWLEQLEQRALQRAHVQGEKIPGWKVVMSGGKRTITDKPVAIQTLIDTGFTAEQVSRIDTQTLTVLDKLAKTADTTLDALLGDLLIKTPGREALVSEDDKRPEVPRSAVQDFA